jgi:hypothetical protein
MFPYFYYVQEGKNSEEQMKIPFKIEHDCVGVVPNIKYKINIPLVWLSL